MKLYPVLTLLALGLSVATGLRAQPTGSLSLNEDGITFTDGSQLTTSPPVPERTLVVAASGGHYDSIQEALDHIGTDLPAASEAAPYLIQIGSGVFEEQVTMKRWVDLEGAGEGITTILSGGFGFWDNGTVVGADNAGLRDLTVKNIGQAPVAVAIYNLRASPHLTRVTAIALGGDLNFAVINADNSSPLMSRVTARAFGGNHSRGIYNSFFSSPPMTDVVAWAEAGEYNTGIDNGSGSPAMTDVTATAAGGLYNRGVRNSGNTGPSAPTMINVTATARGGEQWNHGVSNESSSPTMTGMVARATMPPGPAVTDAHNTGVMNKNSSPTMTNVTATADGGSHNTGVYNWDSSQAALIGSNASGDGPRVTTSCGMINEDSQVKIHSSRVRGETHAIRNDSSTASIAHSELDGGILGAGFACFSVCDESLVPLDENCAPPT